MKAIKKVFALLLTAAMVLGMATTALAANEVNYSNGSGTITISNAAVGETYAAYQIFGATYNSDTKSVAYTLDESSPWYNAVSSSSLFTLTKGDGTNVDWYVSIVGTGTDGTVTDDDTKAVLNFIKTTFETLTLTPNGASTEAISNTVSWTLPYGYYYVTTTQGSAVTIDSNTPSATIYDKNSKTVSKPVKSADDTDVYVGETVTYTVKFSTSNYDGEGENAKKIISYTITDTLPSFLNNVKVTSIIIDEDGDLETTTTDQKKLNEDDYQFDETTKSITIDWTGTDGNSLYKNGSYIYITYTAVVTDSAAIAGKGNTNTVTLTWTDDDNSTGGGGDNYSDSETIYTYAIAIVKVDENGEALTGAKFTINGYAVSQVSDGVYEVTGTTTGASAEMSVDNSGHLVIKGLPSGEHTLNETVAPSGYNLLTNPVTATAVVTTATTTNTTIYLDENGEVTETTTETVITYENNDLAASVIAVVNKTGSELPQTGGIGTTIFYVIGSVLVIGAAVLLITKKRMSGTQE